MSDTKAETVADTADTGATMNNDTQTSPALIECDKAVEEEPPLEHRGDTYTIEYPVLFRCKTLIELSNSSWSQSARSKTDVQPYIRGCKWSPDGTCCLTVINNDGVHVCELQRDLYSGSVSADRNVDVLDSAVHVKESGLVYDFCWYPFMNSCSPETCSWLTTLQNSPIQMWDAFDGSLRCSYRGFNAVDEMEPALSLIFTSDAQRIVAGYKKMLRTFDIERPGRECAEHKITYTASCMATDSNLLAVGSWQTSINLYSTTDMGTYKSIGKMHGHSGGVTHMKFTPNGLKLVSGGRNDHRLLVWDIRYYRRPLNVLTRVVDTNQRIYFDISQCGKYLVTGGTDGVLKVWNADEFDWTSSIDMMDTKDDSSLKFPLHNDCCNSVSIHPQRPILATGSGQYHFVDPESTIDGENCSEDDQAMETEENESTLNYKSNKYSSISENRLIFWWIGDVPELE